MPVVEKTPLVDLCREIGLDHLAATELFRRIAREIRAGNEVIVQEFGTFYQRQSSARQRTLNGVVYDVPARRTNALRGQRFPARLAIASVEVGAFRNSFILGTNENVPPSSFGDLLQRARINDDFKTGFVQSLPHARGGQTTLEIEDLDQTVFSITVDQVLGFPPVENALVQFISDNNFVEVEITNFVFGQKYEFEANAGPFYSFSIAIAAGSFAVLPNARYSYSMSFDLDTARRFG